MRMERDNVREMDWFSIPLEEIQATGWGEYEEPTPRLPSIVEEAREKGIVVCNIVEARRSHTFTS
ncbi:hypothetical protein PVK06_033616 [Gossypium arboreum]|uniref:Uncharacterized protein n=1 Tax=Gossypium arboreum TaxID=29729 RepID=A0ABR0NCU7_GOSAR|nr:hypothetical protein PVK06_033616 [Gossypium arboreum]